MTTAEAVLSDLWKLAGGDRSAIDRVDLDGAEPALPSSFRVGLAAQTTIAAAGLAAAELHRARGGPAQRVAVAMRHAAAEFLSERYFRLDGGPAAEFWDRIAGTYQCGDGRWVRIHTNFPHHRDGILDILDCDHAREAVANALAGWRAGDFEDAVAKRGAIASMMRSFAEWDAHPQGRAVAGLPLVTMRRIGDAPPVAMAAGTRPLSGVRVLDLTRIIAGPVCGRCLAAHGADVLLVTSHHLPMVAPLVIDTGRGKLSCELDLRNPAGRARIEELLGDADVLVQGYRPGAIAGLGLSPERAAAIRPGIVYVSLSAYGHEGPWRDRRGFDSIVQTASGINLEEARAAGVEGPKPLPCQALDHASGYLMAFGATMALARRRREGGSWQVRVALARTGRWLRELGRLDDGFSRAIPAREEISDLLETTASGFGALSAVRHAARLSATPAGWQRPSVPLGTHAPAWPSIG